MNKRKSTSLVAGVCTVCIATATGAAQPPIAPEHHESGARVVSQEVALTASTGNRLVDIAQLPFQNYFTIASTLGQLAAFVPPVNQATGAFLQGNFAPIPALLQKAFIDEMNAIAAVIMLPANIIAYDLGVIFGPPAAANTTLAARAAASAGPSTGNPWLDVAQLPFQNYFTIASTLGQLAAFVPPVNQAMGAFFQGNFAPIQGLLTKAFNDELAAINNVLKLPGEIISYDLSVIGRAIGTVHAPLNANMSSIERDALSATLAAFADKNADAKKPDVIDGEVVSVHTTIGDPAEVDPPAIDSSVEDKKDADQSGEKDAPATGTDATGAPTNTGKKFSDEIGKKYEEVTGKKFSDLIGKKNADTGKKDTEETGKKDAAGGKKDADTAGAIRHAISNATGKKKADKDSDADSAAK